MKLFTLLLILILTGCSSSNPYEMPNADRDKADSIVNENMRWLLNANPKADAFDAITKEDYRFYSLDRHHNIGIPVYERECPDWRKHQDKIIKNTNFIKGASMHGTTTYEQRKYAAIAQVYIDEYNFTLWIHLKEHNKFHCIS